MGTNMKTPPSSKLKDAKAKVTLSGMSENVALTFTGPRTRLPFPENQKSPTFVYLGKSDEDTWQCWIRQSQIRQKPYPNRHGQESEDYDVPFTNLNSSNTRNLL